MRNELIIAFIFSLRPPAVTFATEANLKLESWNLSLKKFLGLKQFLEKKEEQWLPKLDTRISQVTNLRTIAL